MEVGFHRIELARRARELAEQQLEVERSKLAQGLTSAYQLTSVENDVVQAQNGELDAVVSYLDALMSLDRTLGTTLQTWGIEVEAVESGLAGSGGAVGGAAQGTGRLELRLTRPVAGRHRAAASDVDHLDDGWPVLEPARRALKAAERVLDAMRPRAETGSPAGGRSSGPPTQGW